MGKKDAIKKSVISAIIFLSGLLFILPFAWMLSASLKRPSEVFAYPIEWIPSKIQFANYKDVWLNSTYPFYGFYLNSLFVVLLSIFGMLLVSSTSAYALTKINFKGKNVIFFLFLSTLMIPTQVTLIPRFILFYQIGLYDSLWALILPGMFFVVGIFLLRQFCLSIPLALSESAKIDGASHFRIWISIIVPLTKQAMASLGILAFVLIWNEYLDPLIFINTKELYTIPLGIMLYIQKEGQEWNKSMAAATSAVIPVIIIYMAFQKYFIQSIVTTGLKG